MLRGVLRVSMAFYTTTVETALSPAEAFAYMADVTNFATWDPGVKRSVLVQGLGQGVGAGVEHVYFGHTHVPVQGYEFGGMIYHNGGASLQGVEFTLLKAVV